MAQAENKNILITTISTGALAHATEGSYRFLQDYSSPQGLKWRIIPFVNVKLSVAGANDNDEN